MSIKHGLGRGLGALINDGTVPAGGTPPIGTVSKKATTGVLKIPIRKIRKNPNQPRRTFPEETMADLTESIKNRGVLQPLLVRTAGDGYELIAGERRLRASAAAGLAEVPAIIMEATDNDSLEIALIENLQRENLNILEEAESYEVLANKFNLTQEQVAVRVGKARATVTNIMRIMSLPVETKQLIASDQLSAGHAKLLAGLEIKQEQILFAQRAVKENLSVRNLEKLIQKARRAPRKPRATKDDIPSTHISHLSDKLHRHFGTSVRIVPCKTLANGKKVRGTLELDFYSTDDLNRILDLIGITIE
ncbi:MAG: ParB/RepB/Spo0J family partition protein [Kiritimatiellae bacterium]|nr:ParB/RepB/Spo0J family partition protein [Kiritimatiellia bacterium]